MQEGLSPANNKQAKPDKQSKHEEFDMSEPKYGKYEVDAAEEERKEMQRKADFLKLEVGRTVIRFLPPPAGQRTHLFKTWQHFINIPGSAAPVVFACPSRMANEVCPACAEANRLNRTGLSADRDCAKDFWPSRRIFAAVIDRDDPGKGPQIFGFGPMIDDQLNAIRRNEDIGGDYTDPIDGFDIVIEKTGSGLDTRYKVFAQRNTSRAGSDEQIDEWMDEVPELGRFGTVRNKDEIKAMLRGDDPDEYRSRTNTSEGGGTTLEMDVSEDVPFDNQF